MKEIDSILNSNLSKKGVTISNLQKCAVKNAMGDFAVKAVKNHIDKENKEAILEAIHLFPALWSKRIKLLLRKYSCRMACKNAQIRSTTENRKCYVIRNSNISYIVLSTAEVDHIKKIRILGKDVDAIELTKVADFITYPKRIMNK